MRSYLINNVVNLTCKPIIDPRIEVDAGVEYTIENLDKNPLKFLHFLIRSGVIELDKRNDDYQVFVYLYYIPIDQWGTKEVQTMASIIDRARCTNIAKSALLRLLGSEIDNKELSDFIFLLILKKLDENAIPYVILLSEDSMKAVKSAEKEWCHEKEIAAKETAQVSLTHLQKLIRDGAIDQAYIIEVFAKYYIPNIKAFNYTIDQNKKITYEEKNVVELNSSSMSSGYFIGECNVYVTYENQNISLEEQVERIKNKATSIQSLTQSIEKKSKVKFINSLLDEKAYSPYRWNCLEYLLEKNPAVLMKLFQSDKEFNDRLIVYFIRIIGKDEQHVLLDILLFLIEKNILNDDVDHLMTLLLTRGASNRQYLESVYQFILLSFEYITTNKISIDPLGNEVELDVGAELTKNIIEALEICRRTTDINIFHQMSCEEFFGDKPLGYKILDKDSALIYPGYCVVKMAALSQIHWKTGEEERNIKINQMVLKLLTLQAKENGQKIIQSIHAIFPDLNQAYRDLFFDYLFASENGHFSINCAIQLINYNKIFLTVPIKHMDALINVLVKNDFKMSPIQLEVIHALISIENLDILYFLGTLDVNLVVSIFSDIDWMRIFINIYRQKYTSMDQESQSGTIIKIFESAKNMSAESLPLKLTLSNVIAELEKNQYTLPQIADVFLVLSNMLSAFSKENVKLKTWFHYFLKSNEFCNLLRTTEKSDLVNKLPNFYLHHFVPANEKQLQTTKEITLKTLNDCFQINSGLDNAIYANKINDHLKNELITFQIKLYTQQAQLLLESKGLYVAGQINYFDLNKNIITDLLIDISSLIETIINKLIQYEKFKLEPINIQQGPTSSKEGKIQVLIPDIHYTWIGRVQPKVPGQDICGPIAMAEANKINTIYFWCLGTYQTHYEFIFKDYNHVKVRTVESLINEAIHHDIQSITAIGKKYQHLYDTLLSKQQIEFVPIRDFILIKNLFYYLLLSFKGGYVFDTNILPTHEMKSPLLCPKEEKFYAPCYEDVREKRLENERNIEAWTHFSPQNQYREETVKMFHYSFSIWMYYHTKYLESNLDAIALEKYYAVTGNTAIIPLFFAYLNNTLVTWDAVDNINDSATANIKALGIEKTYSNTHKHINSIIFDQSTHSVKQIEFDQLLKFIILNNALMLKTIILLFNKGHVPLDINQQSKQTIEFDKGKAIYKGETLLHVAIRLGRDECIEALLQANGINKALEAEYYQNNIFVMVSLEDALNSYAQKKIPSQITGHSSSFFYPPPNNPGSPVIPSSEASVKKFNT